MMKEEFEKIAGYEVSDYDYYGIIEKMYMASDLSKAEFAKTINKKHFALKPLKSIIKEMQKIAKQYKEACTHYTDYAAMDHLTSLIDEYIERKYNIAGANIAKYHISEKCIMRCFYPESLEIYGAKDYKTLEIIKLAEEG